MNRNDSREQLSARHHCQQKRQGARLESLMITWEDVAKHCFLSAVQTAGRGVLVEKHYLLLKRPHQVLCELGNRLCTWLGLDSNL